VNPLANVETFAFDVFENPSTLETVFNNANLVIGATDQSSVQLKINHESYQRKITTLFGGCYEQAKGGELMYIIPGKTHACLECLESGRTKPEKLGKLDYSNATGPEDYKGEPGLHAAINFITDVAEQYAIALLLRNENCEMAKLIIPERNLLFIGGALGKGYYLFERPFHFIIPILKGPWKKCGTCQ
jgi:molybdopterin/thiamine biosynthesis adenylyltransferase